MEIKKINVLFFIFLMFGLDSLVKIPLAGVQMHVGLWFFVFLGFYYSLACSLSFSKFFLANIAFFSYVLVSLLSIFFSFSVGVFFKLFSYIVFFVFFSMAVWRLEGRVDAGKLFFYLTCLLIFCGWFQFLLYKFFGYQLSFSSLDATYYQMGGSIEGRMRGFFLEPNWFGLFLYLSFCCCLIWSRISPKKVLFVVIMVGLSLFLSGNRIILFLYFLFLGALYGSCFLSRRVVFSVVLFVFSVLFGLLVLAYFDAELAAVDRSFSARAISFQRVLNYFNDFGWGEIFFGFGLSNWGWYSNEYSLGVLNFMNDQNLTSRDTAELHVILFEQGIAGLIILGVDSFVYVRRCWNNCRSDKEMIGCSVVVMSVPLISLVYPLFTFMPYLLPYIFIRTVLSKRLYA